MPIREKDLPMPWPRSERESLFVDHAFKLSDLSYRHGFRLGLVLGVSAGVFFASLVGLLICIL